MSNFQPNQRAACPHCRVTVRLEDPTRQQGGGNWLTAQSAKYFSNVIMSQCPDCLRHLVAFREGLVDEKTGNPIDPVEYLLWPRSPAREAVPKQVPAHIAADYAESAAVLPLSPKASAALSRRCLQTILREAAKTKSKDLSDQIDEVLPSLPSTTAKNLDTIRVVGNFAAHPIKSQQTGVILDVEPGEAEWNLDVLEALFDHYFVRPDIERAKRDEINKKLQEAGKPPLK